MMSVKEAIYQSAVQVLGFEKEDVTELWEADLWEGNLLDSLGMVAFIAKIEGLLGMSIDLRKFKPEDMASFTTLETAIEKL